VAYVGRGALWGVDARAATRVRPRVAKQERHELPILGAQAAARRRQQKGAGWFGSTL